MLGQQVLGLMFCPGTELSPLTGLVCFHPFLIPEGQCPTNMSPQDPKHAGSLTIKIQVRSQISYWLICLVLFSNARMKTIPGVRI